jgi:hypothetical protein
LRIQIVDGLIDRQVLVDERLEPLTQRLHVPQGGAGGQSQYDESQPDRGRNFPFLVS